MENSEIVLATDRYTPSFENHLQMYRATRRWGFIVIMIVLLAYLIPLSVYLAISRAIEVSYTGESFFADFRLTLLIVATPLYLALLIVRMFAPRRLAKQRMRALNELYGNAIPDFVTTFFEDALLAQSGENDPGVRLNYAVFTHIKETRDLFVLKTKEKHLLIVDKQGLSGVDVPGFRKLIHEKCPNAKVKWNPQTV